MSLQRIIGIVIAVVGIVLLVLGVRAADSFASDVSNLFTGNPTNRAIWLTIGGIAAIIVGAALAAMPARALRR